MNFKVETKKSQNDELKRDNTNKLETSNARFDLAQRFRIYMSLDAEAQI